MKREKTPKPKNKKLIIQTLKIVLVSMAVFLLILSALYFVIFVLAATVGFREMNNTVRKDIRVVSGYTETIFLEYWSEHPVGM